MAARPEMAPMSFIGESPEMLEVKRLVQRVGPTQSAVLLSGETGTGKEVVANALYATRPLGRFVVVDCSVMVGPLLESELFGHAKGAFTGAAMAKTGLLEIANGGTAFFDEVGEMSLDLQAKLLRALQDKEIRPVGANFSKRVDFRVIAATHRDLPKEVRAGRFREDLYYRLNVVKLHLPPLRDRKADLKLLIDHFLRRFGPRLKLSPEILDALIQYPWPGNVRELGNCIERMAVMNSGPEIHTGDLPSAVRNHVEGISQFLSPTESQGSVSPIPIPAPPAGASPGPLVGAQNFLTLDERERLAIYEALRFAKDDKVFAAMLLGISRTTLYRKLKRYESN